MPSNKPTVLSRLSIGLIAAILALVFYVLSVGPASALQAREYIAPETYGAAYRPLWWLYEHSPTASDALVWYLDLWTPED